MQIVGIDPGATGSGCALNVDTNTWAWDIRAIVDFENIMTEFDRLASKDDYCVAYIERQHSYAKQGRQMGTTSALSLGENVGLWTGLFAGRGIEVIPVEVVHWQRYHFGSGTACRDTKERSIRSARARCPGIELTPHGCRSPRHGRSDAFLIALYGVAHQKQKHLTR